jgi:hypothetical protein
MRTCSLVFLYLLVCSCPPRFATAATIRVPNEQPTIQAGISAASAGDTVLVSCGTYYEHDIVMKSGVCLMSETGIADCATIDAQQQGRVFYCSGLNNTTSVVGFTVTGGLPDSMGEYSGAGMYCDSSSLQLMNCAFVGNQAVMEYRGHGGGLYCTSSSLTLDNCQFVMNQCRIDGGGVCSEHSSSLALRDCSFQENQTFEGIGCGGGVYCGYEGSAELVDCVFEGNTAGLRGGGMYCYWHVSTELTGCTFSGNTAETGGGAGMQFSHSDATLTGCSFLDNQAPDDVYGRGGGLTCYYSEATVTDCEFLGNEAGDGGGGLFCQGSPSALTSCIFSGNRATGPTPANGGAIVCWWNASATLVGCTIVRNEASHLGGALYCSDSTPTLTNCIIAFNESPQFVIHCLTDDLPNSTPALVCCDLYGNANGDWVGCIADQYGVDGNFSEEPLLCEMGGNDVTLCANSPCLPAGNSCGVLIGASGMGCSACFTAIERSSWGAIKAMYR